MQPVQIRRQRDQTASEAPVLCHGWVPHVEGQLPRRPADPVQPALQHVEQRLRGVPEAVNHAARRAAPVAAVGERAGEVEPGLAERLIACRSRDRN